MPRDLDPENLTDEDIGILVCMARHRVGPGQEARQRLREAAAKWGWGPDEMPGESEEDWEKGTALAQAVVDDYGHLYDEHGKRLPDRA